MFENEKNSSEEISPHLAIMAFGLVLFTFFIEDGYQVVVVAYVIAMLVCVLIDEIRSKKQNKLAN